MTNNFLAFSILSFVLITLAVGRYIDEVKVNSDKSIPAFVSSVQSRNGGSHVEVRVDLLGKSSTLKLHPIPNHLSPSLKVLSADVKNGKLHLKNEDINHELHPTPKLYTDETKKAALTMKQSGKLIEIEGILNSNYLIRPVPSNERHAYQKHNHVIMKRRNKQFNPEKDCGTVNEQIDVSDQHLRLDKHVSKKSKKMMQAQSPLVLSGIDSIQPEVLLILDYNQSAHFDFDIPKIKEYVAVLYYQINRLYETVKDIKVEVYISGILIIKNMDAQPFLEEINSAKHGVDAEKTVHSLEAWAIQNQLKENYNYDLIILSFSGDLGKYVGKQTGENEYMIEWSESPMGICSRVAGACLFQSYSSNVGLCEDTAGYYNGIDTHAHEIAHLLGSTHGGEANAFVGQPSAVDCPSSFHYIMKEEPDNRFVFGPCSSAQIKWFANTLNAHCLWNHPSKTEVDTKKGFPGEWVSLQKQCETAYNQPFIRHIPNDNPADVCRKMQCGYYKITSIQYYSNYPAMEGTPCGEDMHCIRGNCIPKSEINRK